MFRILPPLLLSMASSPASSFFSYRSCRTREGKGMSHTKKCIERAKVEGNKREIQSRRGGRIQVTDSSFVAAKANSGELALHAIWFPFLAKSMPSSFYSLFLAFLRPFCWGEGKFKYRKSFSPYFPPLFDCARLSLTDGRGRAPKIDPPSLFFFPFFLHPKDFCSSVIRGYILRVFSWGSKVISNTTLF